jgi:hypothetical protein
MDVNERNTTNNAYEQFRSSIDMAMGIMYIVISAYATKMNFIIAAYGKTTVWVIASLFIAYGIFRIIRGVLSFRKRG